MKDNILLKLQESVLDLKVSKKMITEEEAAKQKETVKEFYTKAAVGEVYNTGEDNYGKETVQTGTMTSDKLLDLNQSNVGFASIFTDGNMGSGLNLSTDIPTLGDTGLLDGDAETATNAAFNISATEGENTDKVTLSLGDFSKTIRISRKELDYSVVALDNILRRRLMNRVENTTNALILNADNQGGTTNINSNGAAFAADAYYAQTGNGLRKKAIANGVVTITTLTKASFTGLLEVIEEYSDARGDLVCFMDKATALKWEDVLQEELKYDMSKAIVDGYFGTFKGIDFISTRWLAKVDSDGTVNATTPANNNKGQMLLAYKPAVVHGFGAKVQEINDDSNSKGDVEITVLSDIAVEVANEQAGLYKTCALGVVTL